MSLTLSLEGDNEDDIRLRFGSRYTIGRDACCPCARRHRAGPMNSDHDAKVQCPTCYRRASPQLRAVASGLLAVCPYCLSPYLPDRRGRGLLRDAAEPVPARDARDLDSWRTARGED
jgi:hypothetical protein